MKRSTDHIVTTHVGSLPRPHDLLELYVTGADREAIAARVRTAVREVVTRQREVGIEIVDDGEFGKPTDTADAGYGAGTWAKYVRDRLAGFEWAAPQPRRRASRDLAAFPEYYGAPGMREPESDKSREQVKATANVWTCTGPVSYTGTGAVERDIDILRSAVGLHNGDEAFLPVVSPATIARFFPNAYYDTEQEYLVALGEAMRHEYRAIADAGILVQIDDPVLVGVWDFWTGDLDGYRAFAAEHVELLNDSIRGIPEDRLRLHVCWGAWPGPHSTDLPLKDIADIMLRINAAAYSVEASNGRHEHEWKVWREVELPHSKLLIPGVVSHKTAVLEHPEVICDRILRYADAVGRERVIAGTDCGLGGRITSDLAWAKLRSLVEGARLASKALWK